MKKILILTILFLFLASLTTSVFAEENLKEGRRFGAMNVGSKAAMREEKMQQFTEANMERLKERAEKEINRRIESLNRLITRIGEFKKLNATQKSALTSQVQAEIDALEVLLTKIQADTDLETLKADVKSIVESYRIYALFMPKIQIMGAADRMLNVVDKMSSQAALLETKINDAGTGGSDVTELNALLADMEDKIADAKTKAQSALDTVTPLTPAGFPGNKSQLQSARQLVVGALHDLNAARQDGRKIIVGLMKLGKKDEPTPTLTPSPTP